MRNEKDCNGVVFGADAVVHCAASLKPNGDKSRGDDAGGRLLEEAGRLFEFRLPRVDRVKAASAGEGSADVVFLDAIKSEYRGYAEHAARLLRPGGLLIADNCLGADWWITDPAGSDEARDAVDAFNRWIGSPGSGFLSCCVTNREGLVVAQKVG